jgi:hypothetical protein
MHFDKNRPDFKGLLKKILSITSDFPQEGPAAGHYNV